MSARSLYDQKMAMARENPVLAALLRIEALGDQRIGNDQCALSKLAEVRELARKAVVDATGLPFRNELYPVERMPSATDLWNRAARLNGEPSHV